MEKFIKQAGLALASLGLVATATAGSFAPACHCEITLPKHDGGFVFSLEAHYMEASLTGLDYAILDNTGATDASGILPNGKAKGAYPIVPKFMYDTRTNANKEVRKAEHIYIYILSIYTYTRNSTCMYVYIYI